VPTKADIEPTKNRLLIIPLPPRVVTSIYPIPGNRLCRRRTYWGLREGRAACGMYIPAAAVVTGFLLLFTGPSSPTYASLILKKSLETPFS
jgi:hypothetical protein